MAQNTGTNCAKYNKDDDVHITKLMICRQMQDETNSIMKKCNEMFANCMPWLEKIEELKSMHLANVSILLSSDEELNNDLHTYLDKLPNKTEQHAKPNWIVYQDTIKRFNSEMQSVLRMYDVFLSHKLEPSNTNNVNGFDGLWFGADVFAAACENNRSLL